MTLRLAVPSKGRLMEKTFSWFAGHGLGMALTGGDREYAAAIDGADIDVLLMSAGEIPRALAAGRVHLGVTGSDLIRERLAGWERSVDPVTPMGFGHADLIVAVPKVWVDVTHLDDLDAVAAAFRARHGFRLRIATKYHRLVREFLREAGVADYQIVDSQGATEATVAQGSAEAIADITSTGETLRANHLRALEDGVIHRSEATLFRSKQASWDKARLAAFEALEPRLTGG